MTIKRAIVSAAFGAKHLEIAKMSYPTFMWYAQRIGATFVPITERKFPERNPHIEKFQIRDILKDYDTVMWVDCDALISRYACSIFEHVPEGHFAAVDEGVHGTLINVDLEIRTLTNLLGVPFPDDRKFVYFNSGVFIVWKEHAKLFEDVPAIVPAHDPTCVSTKHGINDQTLLNVRVAMSGTPFKALAKTWNMIWCRPGFEMAHILHFAGRLKDDNMLKDMREKAVSI